MALPRPGHRTPPGGGRTPPRAAPPGWSAGAARGTRTRRHPRTPRGGAGTGSRPAQEEELRFLVREARSQQSPRGVLGGVTRRRSALRAGSWPRSAGCPRVLAAPTPRNSTVRVNTAMRGLASLACPFTRVLSQPRATLRGGALTTGAISGREADCACVADLMLILLEATVFSSMKTEVKRNWHRLVRHTVAPAPVTPSGHQCLPCGCWFAPAPGTPLSPLTQPPPQDPAPKRGSSRFRYLIGAPSVLAPTSSVPHWVPTHTHGLAASAPPDARGCCSPRIRTPLVPSSPLTLGHLVTY